MKHEDNLKHVLKSSVKPCSKLVYFYLHKYSSDNNQIRAGNKEISCALNIGSSTVTTALIDLINNGCIVRLKRGGVMGMGVYELPLISDESGTE